MSDDVNISVFIIHFSFLIPALHSDAIATFTQNLKELRQPS